MPYTVPEGTPAVSRQAALDAGCQPTDSVVVIPFVDSRTVCAMSFDLPSLVEPARLRRRDGGLKCRAAGLAQDADQSSLQKGTSHSTHCIKLC